MSNLMRLLNTPLIIARSPGRPVSFSMMLAKISASWGLRSSVLCWRCSQARASCLSIACKARLSRAKSLLPRA